MNTISSRCAEWPGATRQRIATVSEDFVQGVPALPAIMGNNVKYKPDFCRCVSHAQDVK
jgi:hypothetical protein